MARRRLLNNPQFRDLQSELQCGMVLLVCGLFYLCVGTIMVAPMRNVVKEKERVARYPITVGIVFLCFGGFMIFGSIWLWCREFTREDSVSSHVDLYHALESYTEDRGHDVESRLPHRALETSRETQGGTLRTPDEASRTVLQHPTGISRHLKQSEDTRQPSELQGILKDC